MITPNYIFGLFAPGSGRLPMANQELSAYLDKALGYVASGLDFKNRRVSAR